MRKGKGNKFPFPIQSHPSHQWALFQCFGLQKKIFFAGHLGLGRSRISLFHILRELEYCSRGAKSNVPGAEKMFLSVITGYAGVESHILGKLDLD